MASFSPDGVLQGSSLFSWETLLSCLGSVEPFTPLHIYMTGHIDGEDLLTNLSILLNHFGACYMTWETEICWSFRALLSHGVLVDHLGYGWGKALTSQL